MKTVYWGLGIFLLITILIGSYQFIKEDNRTIEYHIEQLLTAKGEAVSESTPIEDVKPTPIGANFTLNDSGQTLGKFILSYETSNCLVDCEAIINLDTNQNFSYDLEKISFSYINYSTQKSPDIISFSQQLQKKVTKEIVHKKQVLVCDESTEPVNGTKYNTNCRSEEGDTVKTSTEVWEDIDFNGIKSFEEKTDYRIVIKLKRKARQGFHAADWKINVDGYDPDWRWFSSNYTDKRNVSFNYFGMGINMPFLLNGTSNSTTGFNLNNSNPLANQFVWGSAPNTNNMSLYSNNNTDYVLVHNNETSTAPIEVEYGNGSSYLKTDIWDKSYLLVAHLGSLTGQGNYTDSSFYNHSQGVTISGFTNGTNTGKFGRAYFVPGAGATSVSFGSPGEEFDKFNTGQFTIEAWLKNVEDDNSPQKEMFSRRQADGTFWGFFDYVATDNILRFGNTNGDRDFDLDSVGIGTHPVGQWRYYVVTKNHTGNITFYVDGAQVGTANDIAIPNITGPVCIGSQGVACGTQVLMQGYAIDEVRFSNITRNATFIRANFNSMASRFGINTTDLTDNAPVSSLTSPAQNTVRNISTSNFLCNATDDKGLTNITLFANFGGSFTSNQTNTTSGLNNQTSFTVTNIGDGNYIWNCQAKDTVNQDAFDQNGNRTITIDTTRPSDITLLNPVNNELFSSALPRTSAIFNLTVNDNLDSNLTCNISLDAISNNKTLGVRANGGNINSSSINITGISTGTHQWNATCYDNANNSNTSNTYFFTINTAPVSLFGYPNDTFLTNQNQTSFVCNGTDSEGLSNISLYGNFNGTFVLNQTTQLTGTSNGTNISVSNIADGLYIWNCYVTDSNNGATFNTTQNRTITIDTTVPRDIGTIAPANNSNNSYTVSSILFNITATDNIDTNLSCNITLDGVKNNRTLGVRSGGIDNSSSITITGIQNGTHWWNVTCYDNANWSNTSNNYVFNINSRPNTPTQNNPPNNSYFNDSVTIPLNCSGASDSDGSDNLIYEYMGNQTNYQNTNQFISIGNSTGTLKAWNISDLNYGNVSYFWACRVFDGLDYSAFTINRTFTVDTTTIGRWEENHTNSSASGIDVRFQFNVSYNNRTINDINAIITYDGVNRTVLEVNITPNFTAFNSTFQLPVTNGSKTIKFNWTAYLRFTNGSKQTLTYSFSQLVGGVTMFNCTVAPNTTTMRVLNISYLRETNNQENLSGNFKGTIWVWGDDKNTNASFSFDINDTKQFYICLTPNGTYYADSIFQYNAPTFDFREYYLINETLQNNTKKIDLYLFEISLGTGITFTVRDEAENPFEGYYIIANRYDPGTNTYRKVAMGKTNQIGQDLIFLRQNDVLYQFIVNNYTEIALVTVDQKIITAAINLEILPTTLSQFIRTFNDITYSLTFDNTSKIFSLSFVTPSSIIRSCLKVIRRTLSTDSLVCDRCLTGIAGSLTCQIDANLTGVYSATYYSSINPQSIITTLEVYVQEYNKLRNKLRGEGAFISGAVVLTLSLVMIASPTIAIVFGLFSFIIMHIFGFFAASYVSIIMIVIIGIIILIKLRD